MNDAIAGLVGFILILTPIAAWLTHVVYCLIAAKYILLLAGGLVFPIGIIHGIRIWFGLGW